MRTPSGPISTSWLWSHTLAPKPGDEHSSERERLRTAFLDFRDRAAHLANEIRKDCPGLTVHDLTHLDALWEIASLLVGDEFNITPTEGFVLGGAILLHDLALSVAAVEGGFAKLRTDPRWPDLITYEYQSSKGRAPSPAELDEPDAGIKQAALFNLLRQIHAENAERLAFVSFPRDRDTRLFLVEDTEVRQTFGRVIGQVAHSHWWSVDEVERRFTRILGAPAWCPPAWTVDPLKIACILRVADAAHLDARRAPVFVRAFSHLAPSSTVHWAFQEKLNKPYLQEDAVVFTASPFAFQDALAWWLCLESLRTVDRELRSVDAMFADKGMPRFAARRVAAVDSPERLASYIQTDGWLPINATVHVTDLPSLIQSIGGEELYGCRAAVALRELIQNACDAVRARQVYEKRENVFGRVTVTLRKAREDEYWLDVADSGVGMSRRVLTNFLLDFGRSFWGSPEMQEEFPGLLASGLKATGKYGIGFFSVFMIAERVLVISRRCDAATHDTLVMEFSSGVQGRPILRPAVGEERLLDGGTCVHLKLKSDPRSEKGILYRRREAPPLTLASLCRQLCPALDIDLFVNEQGCEERAVRGNDWQDIEGKDLLARMHAVRHRGSEEPSNEEILDFCSRAGNNLRPMRSHTGELVGRALITPGFRFRSDDTQGFDLDLEGTVTVGGLYGCGMTGIAGILIGRSMRAARDVAVPLVSSEVLKAWADEQAELIPLVWHYPGDQLSAARYVRLCGGDTKGLPVCKNRARWMTAHQVAELATELDEVLLVDFFEVDVRAKSVGRYELNSNVFVSEVGGIPGCLHSGGSGAVIYHSVEQDWPRFHGTRDTRLGYLRNTVAGAVLEAVACAWGVDVAELSACNDFERENELQVGRFGRKNLVLSGRRIRRPATSAVVR